MIAVDAVRRILVPGEERRFDRWYDQFKEALETPQSPNWNYLCPLNFHKIVDTLEKLEYKSPHERDLFVSVPFAVPPFHTTPPTLALIQT